MLFIGWLTGLLTFFILICVWLGPSLYRGGEINMLQHLQPCKQGMLAIQTIAERTWACSEGQWKMVK